MLKAHVVALVWGSGVYLGPRVAPDRRGKARDPVTKRFLCAVHPHRNTDPETGRKPNANHRKRRKFFEIDRNSGTLG